MNDLAVLAACFLCANLLYLGGLDREHGMTMLGTLGPIYLGIAAFNRAYQARVLESAAEAVTRSLQALVFAAAAILLIAYFLKAGSEFSRVVFAVGMPPENLAARIIARAGAGRVVPSGDHRGLIAAAPDFAADPARARLAGDAARRYAEETFDIARITGKFETIIERI